MTPRSDAVEAVRARFASNLERVRSLIDVYDQLGRKAKGRRAVRDVDLLRAAVVLLHATTEDLLRSLAEQVLPTVERGVLAELRIPLAVDESSRAEKLSLAELAAHRGSTVDAVIEQSIRDWLERSSYNNLGEVKRALTAFGVPTGLVDPFGRKLAALMTRRHWIVHRADRNRRAGPGHHEAQSLRKSTVLNWLDLVRSFGSALLVEISKEG